MSRTLLAASVVMLVVVAPAAAKSKKPPAWMWTTQVATQRVGALELAPLNDVLGTTTVKRCAGKGKHVGKAYAAFACTVQFVPRGIGNEPRTVTLWVKVRKVGRGEPCVSTTAAVPAACTNPKGVRTNGDTTVARVALSKAISTGSIPFQGPMGCAPWGVGYFRCWFGANAADDPSNGWATVILLKTGPVVTVTKEFVKP